MNLKSSDLISLFEATLTGLSPAELAHTGIVIGVGDSICRVHGLNDVVYGEMVEFEGGNKGIVLDIDHDFVSVFLLYTHVNVKEHEVVKMTGRVFSTPVGERLLGRVINTSGKPLDGLGALGTHQERPVEAEVLGVIDRAPVNESLETGIMVIDTLVPIGKGQRELVIGNRNTGKTAVCLDTIIHQKGKDVICIYVSIGQRQANLARTIQTLSVHGALDYCVIVSADSSETVLNQYLAPFVGCAIAEQFRDEGKDVLIVYDDLSNHAIAYREMSLLLRRSPGREAYPGDIFYLHSRLLERAGKFLKGGSITALPLVSVQGDDITAYIPTNLISITDGQIFLDTQLFNRGTRPAVNVELSVSRVGGAAQTKAIKKVTKALRLELAQYHELLDFAQFGAELDGDSQRRLKRGALAMQLLKQPLFEGYSFVDQSLMLYLYKEGFLDTLSHNTVRDYALQFVSYVSSVYPQVYGQIATTQDISEELYSKLSELATEFGRVYVPAASKDI